MSWVWNIPLLTEEGWLRHQEKAGEAHLSAADGVVAHNIMFQNAFRNLSCERPPRPLHQRWLRAIFLMSRPPLLTEEGNTQSKLSSIHSHLLRPWLHSNAAPRLSLLPHTTSSLWRHTLKTWVQSTDR